MSQLLKHGSNESSSSQNMEYHSETESESEEEQITPIDYTVGITFLDIWFPLPLQFPKPYLRLQDVISHKDDALPKPYEWTHDSIKDPKGALGYMYNHQLQHQEGRKKHSRIPFTQL